MIDDLESSSKEKTKQREVIDYESSLHTDIDDSAQIQPVETAQEQLAEPAPKKAKGGLFSRFKSMFGPKNKHLDTKLQKAMPLKS